MESRLERYVLEIPIYWCREDDFDARYDEAYNRYFATTVRRSLPGPFLRLLETDFDRRYVSPWRFNQIVGWLRLLVFGQRIGAEEWFVNAKRFGRNLRKKQFTLFGTAFEIVCSAGQSSEWILEALREELDVFQRQSARGIVLDLECFTEVGHFVHWRSLVDAAA